MSSLSLPDIYTKIRSILQNLCDNIDLDGLAKDEDLLASGILDSFDYMELILEIERDFGFVLSNDEQMDKRTRTIEGLVHFVAEKLGD